VTLLSILLLVTLVLFALFLGGSLVAQGYLYQEPADRLPVRALAAAVLLGAFIIMWVWIDRNHPRKYDTFFEFAPYERKEFTEFEAVRWISSDGVNLKSDESGKPIEVVINYKRSTGAKSDKFLERGTDQPFQLNGGTKTGEAFMTAAILVKPEPEGEAIRLDAQLKEDKRTQAKTYTPDRRFDEQKGSRYVLADQLGVLYVPSTGTVAVALFINLLHFLLWFIAFWPILQFNRGHAFALTTLFGLVTMLLVMPLLFKPNRTPKPAAEAPNVACVRYYSSDPRISGFNHANRFL
jgi:hypothetical protein